MDAAYVLRFHTELKDGFPPTPDFTGLRPVPEEFAVRDIPADVLRTLPRLTDEDLERIQDVEGGWLGSATAMRPYLAREIGREMSIMGKIQKMRSAPMDRNANIEEVLSWSEIVLEKEGLDENERRTFIRGDVTI